MAPLEIQTNQTIGIPIPVGVVMNQLRSNSNQAVVVDDKTGLVALVTKNTELETYPNTDESILQDTTIAGISIYS